MRYACLLMVLLGCATPDEAAEWGDGEISDGAAAPEAGPGPDGGSDLDAGPDLDVRPDAAVDLDAGPDGGPDAAIDLDAALDADAGWGPCAVQGRPGECVPVEDCTGFATPGFCPGPAGIQCCTAESPAPMPFACDPEAYPQPNVGLSEPPGADGCPDGMTAIDGMVGIDGYCIDRYEASLMHVMPDGSEMPWSPYHNPGDAIVRAVSLPGAVPQGYIDGVRAARACAASGKRLCTDAEWLRACQWTDGRTYPYGPARQPGVCNDARARHPAVERFPDDPNPFARIQDGCINQLPDSLARTGSHPGCVTPEGLFDLMGNLHEWTADPAGTFRGGFYVDTVRNGPGCLYRTVAHDTGHWDYSTGFRCCADR